MKKLVKSVKLMRQIPDLVDKLQALKSELEGLKEELMEETEAYRRAKNYLWELQGKDVVINGPAIMLGNLGNCRINIKPQIYPKIVLAECKFGSVLNLTGNHQSVYSCLFHAKEEKVSCDNRELVKEGGKFEIRQA